MSNNRRRNSFFIIASLLVISATFYASHCVNNSKVSSRLARDSFDLNTESGRIAAESRANSLQYFSIQSEADSLMKRGMHIEAVNKFEEAVRFAQTNNQSEWTARYGLFEAYEKSGQSEKAVNELDWLISQKPRPDVMGSLMKKKAELNIKS